MKRLHQAASRAVSNCLSSSPIRLLSEASLPPLRATLTHFIFSFYERALRLPTCFPISGLARLGVKPRLCRSSWRAFAFTHPLMLPSTFPRKALLAYPPSPPWNLSFFTVKSTLFSQCSRSDPPLSRQGAAFPHLDSLPSHDLVLWTDGSVPFPFGKHGFGILANCSLCGTEASLSFSAVPECSSFYPEACAILQDLCWSRHRKHQQVCHFSYLILCPRHLVFSIFPFTSIFLRRSGRNCLFSFVLSRYIGSLGTRFMWGTTQLMSWPDGKRLGALLTPSVILCGLLLFLISTLVFSRTGGVLSHQNFLTHRFPRFPTRNLCSLVMLAVFSLVFAATDTVYF